MTRWSYDNDNGNISRGSNSLPFQTGCIDERETPRIATSGALTIGVNAVPPMPPRLEIVNVAPCIWSSFQLAVARRLGQRTQSFAKLVDVHLVSIANYRDDQALLGVGGEAQVACTS